MLTGLAAQNNVVQNGKAFHQLKMLMHHADMQGRSVVGILDLNHLAILFDGAGFRLIKSEENAHQGRLASAVFAQKRMNLSFSQLKSDIIICLDSREFLGDVQHFNDVIAHHIISLVI